MRRLALLGLVLLYCACATAEGARGFQVSFDASARAEPATGRLVVYLIGPGASVGTDSPAHGPFWHDPQPLYGIDVKGLEPGKPALVDDSATTFGPKISQLPPGQYRVQAVLDLYHSDSSWRREVGNLFSDVVTVQIKQGPEQLVDVPLKRIVQPRPPPNPRDGEVFAIRSTLLSDFRKTDVYLHAGVVFPMNYDPSRAYPVVYEVPGFGGDHYDGFGRFARPLDGAGRELAANAFYITLDPESPNGHTLFADSDVNGPCGAALVKELIPALEAKYKLIPRPSARLLRGHSSGGWSVLWLALQYPDVFGACWSTSPDPVDFRRFELVNIYEDDNAYVDAAGKQVPGVRVGDQVRLTVRGENQQEEVLGTNNTSGQQWDSWQAVFGSRDASGWPKALFDAQTGKLDRAEAEHYRRYDIGHLLRTHPDKFGPIFLQRVRLLCGDMDDYYLNEAVALLQKDVEQLKIDDLPEGRHGYMKLRPGLDHGTIFIAPQMRAIPQEMLDHLRRHGHVK